jgi:hypothetical protein
LAAAAARRATATATGDIKADGFDREAVLSRVALQRELPVEQIEAGLYADLRGAQALLAVAAESAEALVERYEESSVQAVLLRAVRVAAEIECPPALARSLFHKLKFHRLLHTVEPVGTQGYRVVIDGPYSLFEAVTKYGLELALVLPALESCDRLELEADLLWGPRRRALKFRHAVRRRAREGLPSETLLNPDARELLDAFRALDSQWTVEPARTVLKLPGAGLVVPDLTFSHPEEQDPIHLEVLGYWSREAVWRRIELVESGLGARILFAVSSRLRVSEDALAPNDAAALYVFKGRISAPAVARKLEALRAPRRGRAKPRAGGVGSPR